MPPFVPLNAYTVVRPERPFMIVVTGYPQAGVLVLDLRRKSLEEIATFV
jgi:hypothetical protein